MAIDDLFEVASEVSIERHGRAVGFRQRDGFREQTARMRLRRAQDGHRSRVIFDDDFRASAHMGQPRRNVGRGGFCFRDVDHYLSHKLIIHRYSSCSSLASASSAAKSEEISLVRFLLVHLIVFSSLQAVEETEESIAGVITGCSVARR